MKTFSPDMKRSALVILMINSICAFSQIPHEISYVLGCFENGTTQAQYEFDAEEILYMDFDRDEVVYTVPRFIVDDPSKMFDNIHVYENAKKNKKTCLAILEFCKVQEKNPPEQTEPPKSVLYTSQEVELGVGNSLICFVNHFYPPLIKVSWTRNGRPVSEGVSLSRYYPNKDQTFHQFSTLTFTPREGDIYSCTVEHVTLDRPKTRIWEHNFSHCSLGADIYCGVGLTVGLLGVAAGTFLLVKGHHGH
ncbi:H-2 class II histocompatibility antigen, A-U alpha chain-like [Plectropomus leopardus]|uniref:H-2 class II histocompatibility antigen, A-U alpha chain-like n=1 Tax=Plectropomus leopardus TaxID=160734 RepID=UPI001C4B3F04|nr:H-2 class II histocompatibility antigen, A-U alpha chain-like [Plectropomus leopardus]